MHGAWPMGFNRGFHDDCCSRRKTGVVLSRADNLNRILRKLNCSDDPVSKEWGVGNGVLARLDREIEGRNRRPWHRFSFMPFRFFIEGKLLPPLDGPGMKGTIHK